MTTEKAIEFGKIFLKTLEDEKGSATYEFVEMAIKALEIQANKPLSDDWEQYADTLYDKAYKHGWNDAKENKIGYWYKANSGDICYTCSFCGVTNASGTKYNYCPNCGAKMTESEEKE